MTRTAAPLIEASCKDCGAPFLTTRVPVVPPDMWTRHGGRCSTCFTAAHKAAFDAELVSRWPEVQRRMALVTTTRRRKRKERQ